MFDNNGAGPTVSPDVVESVSHWRTVDTAPTNQAFEEYKSYVSRKWLLIIACIILIIAVTGYGLALGSYDIGFFESYEIIWDHLHGNITDKMKDYLIVDYRLPRIVVGIITGAALAVAGATMQSILKNPLADPYTTGVSSGAGFGATIAITAGISITAGSYAIVLNAFVFSLIPTAIIIAVSKLKNASPTTMIMAGIAVMYIFNAMSTVFKLWADPDNLAAVYRWQVGTLTGQTWDTVPLMFGVTLAGTLIIMFLSRELNVLSSGDENAKALGVDADKLRIFCLTVVALVSAVVVSFTGLIGFVGLVAPHIVRLFIGPDNRYLIPASALFGAALLIIADLVGRTILAPTILQVGVVTSFLGGPLFLWLIIRRNSGVWG